MSRRLLLYALLLAVYPLCAGCGSGEPFDYVPVKGKVTWEDGTPIKEAPWVEVTFYSQTPPKDPKINPRPGIAKADPNDGTFKNATSHKVDDGIVPGPHKVTITTFDNGHGQIKGIVPPEYEDQTTTPLTFDTTKDKEAVFKIPKPMK
jgi:hypothetical protein